MSARIKICGLTRAEDARAAADLGVDAVGVVLWPDSPRAATLDQAAAVSSAVPTSTMRVGVFVRPTLDEIAMAIAAAGLTAVQIHGADDPAVYGEVPVPVIWAAALREGAPAPVTPDRMTLLLDAVGTSSMRFTVVGHVGAEERLRGHVVVARMARQTGKSAPLPEALRVQVEDYAARCRGC